VAVIEEMLSLMGLERERFRLVWFSAAEAERFAEVALDMTREIRSVGPSPFRRDALTYARKEMLQCL